MWRSALVACLVLVASSPAAGATKRHRAPSDGQVRTVALSLAHNLWPASTCDGHAVVHVRADDFLNALPMPHGVDRAAGYADPDKCEAWVRSGLTRSYLCIAILHELGHLAVGPGHSGSGIMASNVSVYPPCDRALAHL